MPEKSKEWKLPKNVRQIGDAGGDRKIYVEDYVITYLEGLSGNGTQKKAILFGSVREQELYPYIFVEGAMEVDTFSPDGAARDELQARMGKYFAGKRVVGWFLSAQDSPFVLSPEITDIFSREFSGENQVLIVRDVQEKENLIFVMEETAPVRQPGYYVYFEKNAAMQEYMISRNSGKSVEKEEPVKDDAIRRFRRIIKEKKKAPQLAPGRLVYLASGFLTVTVLALGVTMFYNYDKMKEVERSLARLTNNVDSQSQYLEDDGNAAEVMLHIEDGVNLQQAADMTETNAAPSVETAAGEAAQDVQEATEGTEEKEAANLQQQAAETQTAEMETQSETPQDTTAARASYTVKMGDTLAQISEMYYGSAERVADICTLNGIDDENTILPGQKILLP